jgi:hypothetical protein
MRLGCPHNDGCKAPRKKQRNRAGRSKRGNPRGKEGNRLIRGLPRKSGVRGSAQFLGPFARRRHRALHQGRQAIPGHQHFQRRFGGAAGAGDGFAQRGGSGMTIARDIARAHGGDIVLDKSAMAG